MFVEPAEAQVTFRTFGREFSHTVGDVLYLWGSPMRADGRTWLNVALTGAAFGGLLAVDDQIDSWIVRNPDSQFMQVVEPFREEHKEVARMVTARRLVPLSAVFILAGSVSDKRGLREAGHGCLSGWLMSNSLRYAIYAGVSRTRPSVTPGDQYAFEVPGGDWDHHSFFGGHAMNAFACATFWNERFDLGLVEPVLYVGATAFSLARMADRRHWASDTFLGMVVGYATGRSIAARYERREENREAREAGQFGRALFEGLQVSPGAYETRIGWEKRF